MDWTHFEWIESCKRSDGMTDGRKKWKSKAANHVAGWHQDQWDNETIKQRAF